MLHRLGAVIQAETDAGGENVGNRLSGLSIEPFVNHVPAQGQREPVILPPPPRPQVLAQLQPLVPVGQLSFVNDQAHVRPSRTNGGEDLIERNDDEIELAARLSQPKLEGQKRTGHRAGNGNGLPQNLLPRERGRRDEHGPVAISHARPARQQRIAVADVGVGMNADGRNIQLAAGRSLVEGLDVLENVLELETASRDETASQRVKHEGIVRIRGVAKRHCFFHPQKIKGRAGACHGPISSGGTGQCLD